MATKDGFRQFDSLVIMILDAANATADMGRSIALRNLASVLDKNPEMSAEIQREMANLLRELARGGKR